MCQRDSNTGQPSHNSLNKGQTPHFVREASGDRSFPLALQAARVTERGLLRQSAVSRIVGVYVGERSSGWKVVTVGECG